MNQDYFTQFSDMAKKAQEPFKALAELNVKTLQSLNYIRPDELNTLKNPEHLVEKQLDMALANGRKAIEYMQKSFEIIEKAMLSCAQEVKTKRTKH